VLSQAVVLFSDPDVLKPGLHLAQPVFKLFLPPFFADEVFDLHLFELDGAEDEIPRGNLVAEGPPDLGDA
jgi:hypothetical protein